MAKLSKYSRLFQKYFFREIGNKKRLYSSKLDKIDTMDDIENIKLKERTAGNLVKSLTKTIRGPPKAAQRSFEESKEKTKNDGSEEAEPSEEESAEQSDEEEDEASQRESSSRDEEEEDD